jgi:hypothetical protein
MNKKILLLSLLSTTLFAGTITFYQNLGGNSGNVYMYAVGPSVGPGTGVSFLQVAHGPAVYNVNVSSYATPGATLTETISTEAQAQVPYHSAGTVSGLWVMVNSNGITANSTVRVRINGVNGNEVVTIGSGVTGEVRDTTHTDTINSGDKIDYLITAGASGTNIGLVGIATVFTPSTVNQGFLKWCASGAPFASSTNGFATYYEPVSGILGSGGGFANQTESINSYKMATAGTFSHMGVYVNTNGRAGTTTINFRKNGANGNQTISIGAGVTGLLEDNSHTDTVVVGDTVTYAVVMDGGGGSNTFSASFIESEYTTTNSIMEYPAQTQGHSFNSNDANIMTIQGALGFDAAEAGDYQVLGQVPGTFSNMHIYVQTNTLNQAITIRFRKNHANGNQVITIPAGLAGYFEDTTNSDTVNAGDEIDYRETVPAATGSAAFSYLGSKFTHQ